MLRLLWITSTLFAFLTPLMGWCDDDQGGEVETKKREEAIIRIFRDEIKRQSLIQLNLRIHEMQATLPMPPKSIRRLELAAKGAASRFSEERVKESSHIALQFTANVDQFLLNGQLVRLDQPEKGDREFQDAPEAFFENINPKISIQINQNGMSWNCRNGGGSVGHGRNGGFKDLLENPIWKKSINELFDRGQLEKYQQTVQSRREKSVRDVLQAYMNLHLKLDPDQEKRMAVWLQDNVQVSSTEDLSNYYQLLRNPVRGLNDEGLEQILSDDQLEYWKIQRQLLSR